MRNWIPTLLLAAVVLAGCDDDHVVSPRDTTAPAAPRGVRTVTGDHEVTVTWLANTEADLAGYRVYISNCAGGPGCEYTRIGTTQGTSFVVDALQNGTTRYFDVSAVDAAGNESTPTQDYFYDTPRPEGSGLHVSNYLADTLHAGYDFGGYTVVNWHNMNADVVYGRSGGLALLTAPFTDTQIQDAGYASSLDAVDYGPPSGWAPSGTVEAIPGHCYILLVRDHHYAKLRVTSLDNAEVTLEWAYQIDPDNPELRQRPDREMPRNRRAFPWAPSAARAVGAVDPLAARAQD